LKDGGTAILNADAEYVSAMRSLSKGKTVTFGIENESAVMAKNIRFQRFGETRYELFAGGNEAEVEFSIDGKHNILNALAAAAVGLSFGMTVGEIAGSLKSALPPPQRGELLRFAEGFTVINDSYNSNPSALLS